MKATIQSLALCTLLGLVSAVSIDNTAAQTSIMGQAVTLPAGAYTIEAADGTPLIYSRTNGQAYAPGSGSPTPINLEPLTSPGDTMRIEMGNNKCISAQWNYSMGADWAGVLYVCAIGTGPLVTGLETDKQHWVFVPVGGSGAVSNAAVSAQAAVSKSVSGTVANVGALKVADDSKVANVGALKVADSAKVANVGALKVAASAKLPGGALLPATKPKVAPAHHAAKAHKTSSHKSSCKSRRCRQRNHHRASRAHHAAEHHQHGRRDLEEGASFEKRAGGGQYYIIAYDHLANMATRALTNSVSLSGDALNVPSWTLDVWQQGNQDQIFTVTPA